MVKPLPTETHHIEMHIQQHLENNLQHWVVIASDLIGKYQTGGVALIESTALAIAHYQYRLRAFRPDGSILDLSNFAPQAVDVQGFAYGQFVITRDPAGLVQVPKPDELASEMIAPVMEAGYDFKDNVIFEKDAKQQLTSYQYNKQDARVKIIKPMTIFMRQT